MSTPATDGAPAAGASSLRLVATLTMAGLFSGFAIVGAWEATRPTILANQAEALRLAVFDVVPGAHGLQRLAWRDDALGAHPEGDADEPVVYGAYDADGSLLGYAIPAQGAGFQDTIRLLDGFDPDSENVIGMRVLDSRETPGLGDKIIKDQKFVGSFDQLETSPAMEVVGKGKKTGANQVEAISGATISSKAVVNILLEAHEGWSPRLPSKASAPAYVAPQPAAGEEEDPSPESREEAP